MNILRTLSLASLSLAVACGGPPDEHDEEPFEGSIDTSAQGLISNPQSIGTGTRTSATNTNTVINVSRAVSLGQTVIVSVGAGTTGTTGTCTDTKGNTYSRDATVGGTGGRKLLYLCSARVTTALTNSDTITVTYPSFNGVSVASAVRMSGIASGVRLDRTSANSGTSNSPNSGNTLATTQASELVFGAVHWDGAGTLTAGAGLTRVGTRNVGSGAARVSMGPMYRIVSATGNYSSNGTLTQSSVWRAAVATYFADVGPPTVTISSVSPNPTAAGTTVSWSANEPGTYEVRVRGTSCTTGVRVAGVTAYSSGTINTVIAGNRLNTGVNSIYVCVTDGGGNVGSAISSVTKDDVPPVVDISAASPNPTPAGTTVTWSADQSGTYSVRVGGNQCTTGTQVASGSYTANTVINTAITAAQLPNGSNTVRVCVADPAANTGNDTIVVLVDSGAPVVTLVSATPNPTSAGVTVTWSADEVGTYDVRVGGINCSNSGTVVESGSYNTANASVVSVIAAGSLASGPNTVRVCVRDAANNRGGAAVSVVKDTVVPTVVIDDIAPNPTAAGTSVSWTGSEDGTYSVRVGGTSCTTGTQIATGAYDDADGSVATAIPSGDLSNGSNTIRVCLTDTASNQGQATGSVDKDATAPTVTVVSVSPNPSSLTGTTLTFDADEDGDYSVRVGGASCATGLEVESGVYTTGSDQDVSIGFSELSEGANTVRVCVTDALGNVGQAVTTATRDTTLPTVNLVSISPNPTTAGATVVFNASETGSYNIRVGGTNCATGTQATAGGYTAPGNASAVIPAANLAEGANTVRVCVSDSAGNAGSATGSVTKDSVVPTITSIGVSPNPSGTAGTTLSFTASEGGTYEVRVGGASCAAGTAIASGPYTSGNLDIAVAAASLAEGPNTLRVCVTDAVGNTGNAATTATKDSVGPVVTIVSTTPASTANASVDVIWRASETGTYSVRIGGTSCSTGTSFDSGAYSPVNSNRTTTIPAASFAQGANTVRVCVVDALANEGSATTSVLRDSVVPVVTFVSISPSPTNDSTVLTFNASESGTYTLRVAPVGTSFGCASGTVVSTGSYTAPGNLGLTIAGSFLVEGVNDVRLCLRDDLNNTGTRLSTVTKDSVVPVVTIDSITPSPTSAGTTVTWHASENGAFSVRVGGTSCTDGAVVSSGTYSTSPATRATSVPAAALAEGANTIRVCLSDGANTGSAVGSVTKDSVLPIVTVGCLAPTSGTSTVTFSSTESGAYSVRVGGTTCAMGTQVASGTYTAPGDQVAVVSAAQLSEGPNTIRVCVTDSIGNVGDAVSSVLFQSPVVVDLASTPADRTFLGGQAAGEFGSMDIGDLNNNGIDDLVVAERPGRNAAGAVIRRTAGTAYGYLGGSGFFSGASTAVPAGASFQILGGDIGDDLGVRNLGRISAGVDVTGDGVGDLVISAPGADGVANGRSNAGEVYVLSGAALTGFIDLAGDTMPAPVFSRIIGPAAGGSAQVLEVRDADGDGLGDLVIGVPLANPGGRTFAGEVYVVRGGATLAGTVDLASSGNVISRIEGGAAGDQLGTAAALGDFGGTSAVDLLLGAPSAELGGGAAYGVFGPFSPTYDVGAGDADVEWLSDQSSRFGHDVGLGNVRGDGSVDVVITARRLKLDGVPVGGLLVFDGPITAGSNVVPNTGAYGSPDSLVFGEDDDDSFGASLQHRDMNGDGYDDLLIGAYRSDGPGNARAQAGSALVLLGGQCMTARSDLSYDVPAALVHGPRAGGNLARFHAASGTGDLDGDGNADYCVAAQVGGNGETYCFTSPW